MEFNVCKRVINDMGIRVAPCFTQFGNMKQSFCSGRNKSFLHSTFDQMGLYIALNTEHTILCAF